MSLFTSKINTANTIIKFINLKNDQLLQTKTEVENATGNDQQAEVSQKITSIVNEFQSKQIQMKALIEELDALVRESKDDADAEPTELRIKQNLFGSMMKTYQTAVMKFQAIEGEIKTIIQTKIIRSAEIVLGHSLKEEEKAQVLNEPQQVQMMYQNKLTGAAHVKLQNAVSDLQDRHKDILNLEKSILQVHNLIIELSQLVHLQGEMIDNIVDNLQTSKDYVAKAEKDLVKSKENMKKARKKKCIILIILIVVVVVVVVVPVAVKTS